MRTLGSDLMHNVVRAPIRRYARKLRARLAGRPMTARLSASVVDQLCEHDDWRANALAVDILSEVWGPLLGLWEKRRARRAWLWPRLV